MEVWFSFNARVTIYPELKKLCDEMQNGLYRAAGCVIDALLEHKLAETELDADLETEKLYTLVDGLVIHQLMQSGRLKAERLEYIIDQHLNMDCSGE